MEDSQHNSEKEEGELSSDDDYQSKLSEMQTYIPFLQQMIQRLEQSNDRSREAQLSKMKSLYGILSNTKKKLKVETLKRCEDVLRNLMNKVEKSSSHKEGGKVKKKIHRDSSHSSKAAIVSDSSNSSPSEHIIFHSKHRHTKDSDDFRVGEKMSDHEAVVSSTTQSGDSENSVTDVVKALKLAAARNNLRNKLENVKTAMHSPNHSDDTKGNVSSSSPSHLVSSSSPTKQHFFERNDHNIKEGLEQSRERLKKLMGHHLTATPSPPYHSPNDAHSRSFERNTLDIDSPKTDWLYAKDNSWEQYTGAHSIGSDSCDGELFTRRDVWHTEKSRTQSTSYNTFQDDDGLKTESNMRPYDKLSPKSDVLHKSPSRSMKIHLPSSPSLHSKMFSPERSEESDKSDSGSGPRRLRAKLEQEIHKVHRVGVSTGGALRSLVAKDDRNKSLNKSKSDDEKSPKSTKSSENFDRSGVDCDKKRRERSHKSDEKHLDPRRPREMETSIDRSPSPVKNTTSTVKSSVDNSHSKSKDSNKFKKSDNVSRSGKEGAEMFSGMSHEELKRIVSENLRNLPSPPPITKEILETVKISPKPISNPVSNPPWKSPAQPFKPSTPASPDEVFLTPSHSQQDAYSERSQQFGKGRQGNVEDEVFNADNHQIVDDLRMNNAHSNSENMVRGVYGVLQSEERRNVIHHEFESRPAFVNPQNLENMRMTGPPHMAEEVRTVTYNHLSLETSRDRSCDTTQYQGPVQEDPRHHQGVDDHRALYHHGIDDPKPIHHNVADPRQVHHHGVNDPRQMHQHGVDDPRQGHNHGMDDPRQMHHHGVDDPRQMHHHSVDDPRQMHHHGMDDSRQMHHHGMDDPRQTHHHGVDDPRQMHHHGVDDPRQMHHHGVDDPRVNMSHTYRDDVRRDHPRKIDDTRIGGERRRGLLPTPPKYEKYNYMGPTVNTRRHVQDISTRFDQNTHLNENRNNSLISSEHQNWDAPHWGNTTVYPQNQKVERFPQQMFHSRDNRGQMNVAPNEQFSPTGHTSNYQWGAGDGHNTQQQPTMHNNFLPGFQAQLRVDHVPDHNQTKSRGQHADPRLHKGEHPEAPPDMRTGDPRISHSEPRHSTQYSGSRQPLVAGMARIAPVSDRDPRRRSVDEADTPRKPGQELDDKKKRHSDSWRSSYMSNRSEKFKKNEVDRDRKRTSNPEQSRNREDEKKNPPKKDSQLHSPLDCLYGTTAIARTGKGYGFQNFRIPKIKRDVPVRPRPPTPPRPAPPKEKFEATVKEEIEDQQLKEIKEEICNDDRKENACVKSELKVSDFQTRELTQEFIESLIRKSFESGEGKKLFEHAKFFEKLSESLKNKKLRKIKRILESDSDDSDSDHATVKNKEEKESKETANVKLSITKEPVVDVLDSDDEPLSEKLESKVKNVGCNLRVVSDVEESSIADTSCRNLEMFKDTESKSKDLTKDDNNTLDVSKPAKKPVAKRRNALELLQQDVRDMFIREGVVTATGYRMCRLLKEVQSGASFEEISKNEAKRMEDEAEGESDSSSAVGRNEKKIRGKIKTKKKVTISSKSSKKVAKSSQDTLSDDETQSIFSSKKRTKRNRVTIEDSDSDSSVSTVSYRASKTKSLGTRGLESDKDIVRRRRIPRIILEKTDLSKFRSTSTKNTAESEERSACLFNEEETKKRVMLRRNNKKVIEGRNYLNTVVNDKYFNSEPYLFKRKKLGKSKSFLGKKINDVIPRLHKSQIPNVSLTELFSVDQVSISSVAPLIENSCDEKQNKASFKANMTGTAASTITAANTGGDDDDEKNDSASLLERLHKKLPVNEKDNKSCLDIATSIIIEEEEEKNSSLFKRTVGENTDKSDMELSAGNILVANEQEKNISKSTYTSNTLLIKSPIKLNLVKKKGTQRKKKSCKWRLGIIKKKPSVNKSKADFVDGKHLDNELVNDAESFMITVDDNLVNTNENDGDRDNYYENDASIDQFKIHPSSEEKERKKDTGRLRKEFAEKSVTELVNFTDLDYAYHFEAKQTACLLCTYEGRAIVQHYKQVHPDNEVLISRLPIDEACRATTESEDKGYNESSFKEDVLGTRKGPGSFFCRFCNYKAQYAVSFYEHTSSHTGEYRYQCCKCPYMSASRTTFKGHFYNHHPKNKLKQGLNLKVLTEGPSNSAKFIFGYLCSKCNFVQLLLENIQKHISLRHVDDIEVKPIRINMSKSATIESTDVSDGESCVDISEMASEDEEIATYGDTEEEPKEYHDAEDAERTTGVKMRVKLPLAANKKEGFEDSGEEQRNENVARSCEKKPNVLEAFLPVSFEVDKDECVILEERVKRTQCIIDKVNLSGVVSNLEDASTEDSDIVILFENKLRKVKLEMDCEMEIENSDSLSGEIKILNDESDTTNPNQVSIKKELDHEKSDINEIEEAETPALNSDGARMNASDMEVSCEEHALTSPVVESEKEKSSIDMQDVFIESKSKVLLRRPSDVAAEPNTPHSLNGKGMNGDELGERRITRSLSRTDEDGRSIMSDDSGCDTSNFEVIEITDESDVGENDIDVEAVINHVKSLQNDTDEGVSLPTGSLIQRLTKRIVSKDNDFIVPMKASFEEQGKKESPKVSVKPPPMAVSLNKQSKEEKKTVVKLSSVVQVASLEAKLCPDKSIQFSCPVPSCVFITTDALLMEKHLTRSHKPNWWDGVCEMCDKRVYGDDFLKGSPVEHKYPLSFALDHLRTVHLEHLSGETFDDSEDTTLSIMECKSATVTSDTWVSTSLCESQVLIEDTSSAEDNLGQSQSETEETSVPVVKAPYQYIRMRRLSGDKLSAPVTSQSPIPSAMDTSSDSFTNLVSEGDSNILTNEGGDDDDLPFLKIESVVSLHPSAGLNVSDSFDGQNELNLPVSDPASESPSTPPPPLPPPPPPQSTSMDSCTTSSLTQQCVTTLPQKLLTIPTTSSLNNQIQLVPVSAAPRGTIAVVPGPATSTNIPQPLVNLAQLIRPGTRVVVPRESSPVHYVPSRPTNAVLLSGGSTLPNILPKPPPPTFINIITSPGKSSSPTTVVIPPTLVASSSLSSPSIVISPTSSSNSSVITSVAVLHKYQQFRRTGNRVSQPLKAVKSSAVFVSDCSARTSYFPYQRLEHQNQPFLRNTRQKLSHKNSKTFELAKASKLTSVYQRMLIHDKLRQLFKCMAKHCNFTSDCPTFFEDHCCKHVNLYQKLKYIKADKNKETAEIVSSGEEADDAELEEIRKIETGGWPQCAYCCTLHDSPRALNTHVQNEHGQCRYQCAYCFFRAITYSYVVLHQNTNHTDMRITVLLCRKIPNLLPQSSVKRPRAEVVLPYVCKQGKCGMTFWNPAAFWRHLENSHASMTYYLCHLCVGQYVKPEKLLIHYKLHCLCYYQCQYCLHGSDTIEDMQHHLCNFHPNQKAVLIMRDSDPNMPATGSEEERSIEHLKLINLDEGLREESIIFPPVPSPEFRELTGDFWRCYRAFADENPNIDICDDNLLSASAPGTAVIYVLPRASNNSNCSPETPMTPTEVTSKNVEGSSGICSNQTEVENKASDPTESSDVDPTDRVNSPSSSPGTEDSSSGSRNSSDTDDEVVPLDSTCSQNKKPSPKKNKIGDCDVILIDDSSDTDEQCESSEHRNKNEIPPIIPSKLPSNNEDSDSDVMIIGSDDEIIPNKRQKINFSHPLQESDPNYEPVVTLRHRNPESRARIESAIDPLAPDPLQKDDNSYINSRPKDSEEVLNLHTQDTQRKPSFPENIILIPDDPDSSELRTINVFPQDNENSSDEDIQTDPLMCDTVDKKEQQQNKSEHPEGKVPQEKLQEKLLGDKQFPNNPEKGKAESPSTSKDIGLDLDILAQSTITAEELAKTGVSGEHLYRCGNFTCAYGAPGPTQLRDHLLICDLSRESAGLTCVHCQRPFKQITPFMEHLKHHGTCRYNCFMCKFRAPLSQQVIKHLKQKHRIYNSIVLPVNQQNTNPDKDLFVVCSKDKTRPKVVPHFRNKRIYNPEEVGFLPVKYISYQPLTCSVCNFRSKVVSNMRRHLNFHNNKSMEPKEIPLSDPVNPVPHLEKKEMMFDKMTNLAASSHPLGRMGGKPPPSASSGGTTDQFILPKFVPENERYVCGSPGCNYLTCDETMLRYHMRALHCDETSYRCPHCPETMQKDINGLPISVDRMGAHLKMHDSRLYKCTHCLYHHFQRHIVERHLTDKHPEKRPFVQVVREEGEANKLQATGLGGEGNKLPLNTTAWMCGLCKVQFTTRAEVFEHASMVHNMKSHFKCGLCTFRSSSKPNCETHFYSRHPGVEMEIITICQRVDGDAVDLPPTTGISTPALELPSKRFDTTPLWLRNMVRIRHIRGVLLEDEEETRIHLQKIDENFVPKKTKIKESIQPLSDTPAATPDTKEPDYLEQKFAPYGKPVLGNFFFCTLCNKYKTRFKADMREHLYRELNYVKWMCQHCNLTSCNKHQIVKHSRVHEKESKPESIVALQVDKDTELWVDNLLSKQHYDMKGIPDVTPAKQISTAVNKAKPSPLTNSSTSCGPSVSSLKPTISTPNSKLGASQKAMDLTDNNEVSDDEISLISMIHSSQKRKLITMVKKDFEDFEESKSKKSAFEKGERSMPDGEMQAVASEESTLKGKSPLKENQVIPMATPTPTPTVVTKNYKCKDCKATFSVVRGLKLHVRLVHLRLGSYICGYCDRPAYSEMAMKQHCKSQHRSHPELIIYNKEASNVKLDEEFWEREYGIKPKGDECVASKKYQKTSGQFSAKNVAKTTLASTSAPPVSGQLVSSKPFSACISPSSDLPPGTSSAVNTSREFSGPVKNKKESGDADEIVLLDEITRKCAHCEYRCKSASDLRSHEMRHWAEKPFKCGHCEFEAVREYELKKHSAKAHPNKQVRIIQKQLPSTPEIKPLQRPRKTQYNSGVSPDSIGGNDDTRKRNAELQDSPSECSIKPEEESVESRKMFRCFYCPLRATSLGIVHKHWEKTHKGKVMSTTGVSRHGLPFRYKEVDMNDLLKGRENPRKKKTTTYACSYCNKKGTYSSITLHHKQSHPDMPIKIAGVVAQYECAECQLITLSSVSLKRHFEAQHPEKEFRYMVRTAALPVQITDAESFLSTKEDCKESLGKAVDLPASCDKPPPFSTSLETVVTAEKEKSTKYVCSWCSETCSPEKINFHHAMFHSHLEQKFTLENSSEPMEQSTSKMTITQFLCPKCSFKVPSFEEMCEHLRKHCRPFKCGYCGRLYELPNQVRNHLSLMHPNQPPKIISMKEMISDLSTLKSHIIAVEEKVDSVQFSEIDLTGKELTKEEPEVPCKKQMLYGFARKSTSMKQKIFPVARKSTNPSPYSYNKRIEQTLASSESGSSRSPSPTLQEEFSYYGQKVVPLDWKKIRTTVNYGGVYVQVNVDNMAQIFNLNPIVLVKDLKTQWKV